MASADAEENREDRHLENLVLRDGFCDVVGKDIEDDLLPPGCVQWAAAVLEVTAGSVTPTPAREILIAIAPSSRPRVVTTSKNTIDLSATRPTTAQLSVTCNAVTMPRRKRRDNHADQAQEYLAKEVRLRREARSVNTQLDACQHGKKSP